MSRATPFVALAVLPGRVQSIAVRFTWFRLLDRVRPGWPEVPERTLVALSLSDYRAQETRVTPYLILGWDCGQVPGHTYTRAGMPTARSTGTDYRTWSYLRCDTGGHLAPAEAGARR